MTLSRGARTAREYRLHWLQPAGAHPGLPDLEGAETSAWIGSEDPRALKRWAAGREWPEGAVVTISLGPPGQAEDQQAHCTPADLEEWDPDSAELLPSTRAAPRPVSPARDRLALFGAVRAATDAAVLSGALAPDLADALLVAAREAVEETRRRRRAAAVRAAAG